MIGALHTVYLRLQLTSVTVHRCAGWFHCGPRSQDPRPLVPPRTRTHHRISSRMYGVCTTSYLLRHTWMGIHGWAYMASNLHSVVCRAWTVGATGENLLSCPLWLFVATLSGPPWPSLAHGIMQVPSKNMRYLGCSSDKYSTLSLLT